MTELRIAEFSKFPGGRFKKYGPHSGEEFRRERLMPAIKGLERRRKISNRTYQMFIVSAPVILGRSIL